VDNIHLCSDDELIKLLRDADEAAFTEIYNRYWDKLYYLGHKILKDQESAEEIVQDVFLVLWDKRNTLNIQSLPQYLAAMTRYAVYKQIARDKHSKLKEDLLRFETANAVSELNVDNKILLEIIATLSNKLPEKCRLVFQHNKLQDKSLAEVATQLNMSQKTAEGHLTKALRMIRSNLGKAVNILLF
jgi:RNA polymerase sigma-70 factor (family 1)